LSIAGAAVGGVWREPGASASSESGTHGADARNPTNSEVIVARIRRAESAAAASRVPTRPPDFGEIDNQKDECLDARG
jgi:hypothetical protein